MDSGDTAQRSLEHWSEQGRREMEKFTRSPRRTTASSRSLPTGRRFSVSAPTRMVTPRCRLRQRQFPTALVRFTAVASLPGVAYDLLDPSAFSIATARAALAPPFMPRNDLVMPLQELPSSCGPYDVVWATHALYAIPPDELDVAMARFASALAPEGLGVVAQATGARTTCRSMTPTGPGCVTQLLTPRPRWWRLLAHAGMDVREQVITYETRTSDRDVAEGFLQRCAFDDTVSLEEMEAAPVLGEYLASCRRPDGSYVFSNEVALLWM